MAPSVSQINDSKAGIGGPEQVAGSVSNPPERYGQPLPDNWIPLYDQPTRTPTRRLRVVTIGAGIASMLFAYKIHHEHKLQDILDNVIYEANDDIGGTWLVNTYPGVACDVPAHIYTFPFEPNPNWSAYYAGGAEILEYFKRTVAKYNLDRDVKCSHKIIEARFDETRGQWDLKIQHKDEVITDTCDVLISAVGFLNHWRWPKIDGLDTYKGHVVHSAVWDNNYDYSGKNVGIIGNGSSAIQIAPHIANVAGHLTNFVRSATWITAGLGSAIIGGKTNYEYSEEEKRHFRENPEALKTYRRKIQHGSNAGFAMFTKNSRAQAAAKEQTTELMRSRLNYDEDLAASLIPTWEVGCRRATPGPGYLESFTQPNVSLVTSPIERIVPAGIETADGTTHELDAIVCATGFDVSHRPAWPLVGRGGRTLAEAWEEEPASYLSLGAAGFPNFWLFSGPNAPVGHGSLMAGLGWSADWMVQWLRKMAAEDIAWVDPKQEAVDDFNTYGDEIMQTLVWSGGCRSWYKNNRIDGKVTAVWPGSAIAYKEMIDHIRPEDFEIRYRSRNRFRFMGCGKTKLEFQEGADLGFYLYK